MSRNSKNARLHREAKEMGKLRQGGGKGPSRTTPKHGKKNAWWQRYSTYSSFVAGGKRNERKGIPQDTKEELVE